MCEQQHFVTSLLLHKVDLSLYRFLQHSHCRVCRNVWVFAIEKRHITSNKNSISSRRRNIKSKQKNWEKTAECVLRQSALKGVKTLFLCSCCLQESYSILNNLQSIEFYFLFYGKVWKNKFGQCEGMSMKTLLSTNTRARITNTNTTHGCVRVKVSECVCDYEYDSICLPCRIHWRDKLCCQIIVQHSEWGASDCRAGDLRVCERDSYIADSTHLSMAQFSPFFPFGSQSTINAALFQSKDLHSVSVLVFRGILFFFSRSNFPKND